MTATALSHPALLTPAERQEVRDELRRTEIKISRLEAVLERCTCGMSPVVRQNVIDELEGYRRDAFLLRTLLEVERLVAAAAAPCGITTVEELLACISYTRDGDRYLERALKNRGGKAKCCPRCAAQLHLNLGGHTRRHHRED